MPENLEINILGNSSQAIAAVEALGKALQGIQKLTNDTSKSMQDAGAVTSEYMSKIQDVATKATSAVEALSTATASHAKELTGAAKAAHDSKTAFDQYLSSIKEVNSGLATGQISVQAGRVALDSLNATMEKAAGTASRLAQAQDALNKAYSTFSGATAKTNTGINADQTTYGLAGKSILGDSSNFSANEYIKGLTGLDPAVVKVAEDIGNMTAATQKSTSSFSQWASELERASQQARQFSNLQQMSAGIANPSSSSGLYEPGNLGPYSGMSGSAYYAGLSAPARLGPPKADNDRFGLGGDAGALQAGLGSGGSEYNASQEKIRAANEAVSKSFQSQASAAIEAKRSLDEVKKSSDEATKSTNTHKDALDNFMGRIASFTSALVIYKVLREIGSAFNEVASQVGGFQQQMLKIQATTDTSSTSAAKYSTQIRELALTVPQTAEELAKGFYFIASSGFQADDAMKVLTATSKAAAGGFGEITTLSRSVSAALLAYHQNADQAAHYTDVFAAAIVAGAVEAEDFAGSIGRVLPVAANLKVPIEQVTAAIAAMTNTGLSADESTTALRGFFNELIHPSKEAEKQLEDLGLTAGQLRDMLADPSQGLAAVIEILRERVGGNDEALAKIIPNIRALNGFLSIAAENADSYNRALWETMNATDRTSKSQQTMAQGVAYNSGLLRNAINDIGISAGSVVLGPLAAFFGAIANGLHPMKTLADQSTATGEKLGEAGDAADAAAGKAETSQSKWEALGGYLAGGLLEKISQGQAGLLAIGGTLDSIGQLIDKITGKENSTPGVAAGGIAGLGGLSFGGGSMVNAGALGKLGKLGPLGALMHILTEGPQEAASFGSDVKGMGDILGYTANEGWVGDIGRYLDQNTHLPNGLSIGGGLSGPGQVTHEDLSQAAMIRQGGQFPEGQAVQAPALSDMTASLATLNQGQAQYIDLSQEAVAAMRGEAAAAAEDTAAQAELATTQTQTTQTQAAATEKTHLSAAAMLATARSASALSSESQKLRGTLAEIATLPGGTNQDVYDKRLKELADDIAKQEQAWEKALPPEEYASRVSRLNAAFVGLGGVLRFNDWDAAGAKFYTDQINGLLDTTAATDMASTKAKQAAEAQKAAAAEAKRIAQEMKIASETSARGFAEAWSKSGPLGAMPDKIADIAYESTEKLRAALEVENGPAAMTAGKGVLADIQKIVERMRKDEVPEWAAMGDLLANSAFTALTDKTQESVEAFIGFLSEAMERIRSAEKLTPESLFDMGVGDILTGPSRSFFDNLTKGIETGGKDAIRATQESMNGILNQLEHLKGDKGYELGESFLQNVGAAIEDGSPEALNSLRSFLSAFDTQIELAKAEAKMNSTIDAANKEFETKKANDSDTNDLKQSRTNALDNMRQQHEEQLKLKEQELSAEDVERKRIDSEAALARKRTFEDETSRLKEQNQLQLSMTKAMRETDPKKRQQMLQDIEDQKGLQMIKDMQDRAMIERQRKFDDSERSIKQDEEDRDREIKLERERTLTAFKIGQQKELQGKQIEFEQQDYQRQLIAAGRLKDQKIEAAKQEYHDLEERVTNPFWKQLLDDFKKMFITPASEAMQQMFTVNGTPTEGADSGQGEDSSGSYASGGSFTVPGSGAEGDNHLVRFYATPGEHVSITPHFALGGSFTVPSGMDSPNWMDGTHTGYKMSGVFPWEQQQLDSPSWLEAPHKAPATGNVTLAPKTAQAKSDPIPVTIANISNEPLVNLSQLMAGYHNTGEAAVREITQGTNGQSNRERLRALQQTPEGKDLEKQMGNGLDYLQALTALLNAKDHPAEVKRTPKAAAAEAAAPGAAAGSQAGEGAAVTVQITVSDNTFIGGDPASAQKVGELAGQAFLAKSRAMLPARRYTS